MGLELTRIDLESTSQGPPQTGPEMALRSPYLDLRKSMVQNRHYLRFLLLLLREYVFGPRIGYGRLLVARNIDMVIRIAGYT